MKALVIAPQPFFTCRGTPLSVYYRTLITAELGVDIDLLTYGEGEEIDIPGVNVIRIPHFKWLGPVKVGPSVLKLFLDLFMIVWTIGLLFKRRYQFVHAHEEAVFFCWVLKPIFRFQLVYDMHSSLPEQLSNFKFTTSKWLIGLFAWLEQRCLRAAEVTITICPSLDNYALRLAPKKNLVTLIENSIFEDIRFAQPLIDLKPLNRASLSDRLIGKRLVVYAGTLETYQGIDVLIHGFKQALRQDRSLFLLIIGGTPAQVNEYKQMARDCELMQHCQFMGRVSPKLARYYTGLGAVQVSPRLWGTNTPLKMYEQIASKVPLVATKIYAHTQILDDSMAFLVEPTSEGIAEGILAVTHSPATAIRRKVKNAQKLYEQCYSRQRYVDKMRGVLRHLGIQPLSVPQAETLQRQDAWVSSYQATGVGVSRQGVAHPEALIPQPSRDKV